MNTYKIYNNTDDSFVIATRLSEVAELCGVTLEAASKCFWNKVTHFNCHKFTVLTYPA